MLGVLYQQWNIIITHTGEYIHPPKKHGSLYLPKKEKKYTDKYTDIKIFPSSIIYPIQHKNVNK